MIEQGTLLPVGELLELNNTSQLEIKRFLSSGLTGEVYEGELHTGDGEHVHVAVKAMKSLEFAMARQLFERESQTLAMLQGFEREANKKQRLSLNVVPAYYGRSEWNETPYFVMEFIQGREIPDLIEQVEAFPSEHQALKVAWHLYRTLDIMHTRLRKTYIDLKFEDLWWVGEPSSAEGQLKLTDFGTLEEVKEGSQEGVLRDLLLAAVYLCSMLTGHTLDYSLGRLRERAIPIISQADVSWGTRRLLEHLLHPAPEIRPTSAKEVAKELRILVNFWQSSKDDLEKINDFNLQKAQSEAANEEKKQAADRTRAGLDIAARRQLYSLEKIQKQIAFVEEILRQLDPSQQGKELLDQGKCYEAQQMFEKAKHGRTDPANARRWSYAAKVCSAVENDVFKTYKPRLFDLVEALNNSHLKQANDLLKELATSPLAGSDGFRALQAEYDLISQIEIGESCMARDEYLQAAEAFKYALSALAQLPDAQFVAQEELGDTLQPKIDKMMLRHRTKNRARVELSKIKTALEKLYAQSR